MIRIILQYRLINLLYQQFIARICLYPRILLNDTYFTASKGDLNKFKRNFRSVSSLFHSNYTFHSD